MYIVLLSFKRNKLPFRFETRDGLLIIFIYSLVLWDEIGINNNIMLSIDKVTLGTHIFCAATVHIMSDVINKLSMKNIKK